MKKFLFLLVICVATAGQAVDQKWSNPLTLSGEWEQYGIGDPYILKYRGIYYLYCSTRDRTVGIKCWASKDLVNWSEAYTCSTDPITLGAYAPEVVYWNGTFYMYTSPQGNGHYVLTSPSPTGPFTRVTENMGKSIDGSVFIEDNGLWYFYHAGGGTGGIQGCSMESPTSIGGGNMLGVSMRSDWTEGPTVIKRNDTYYIIYTGNHVISKGYRIDYAKNTTGALNIYTPQNKQNPILISTEGAQVGLGHGSAFIGPDLDSYYYTYHSLANDFGWGPYRRFNYDRIAWNGDKMSILGPTNWGQQAPELADFSDFFERTEIGEEWTLTGGNWGITNSDYLYQDDINSETLPHKALISTATGSNYTAEFTLREAGESSNDARLGAVFGYSNEQNYGTVLFRTATRQLEVCFQENGVWGDTLRAPMPSGYSSTAWHSIRIEKYGDNYKIFADGMLKITTTSSLAGGRIGYTTSHANANFGYIAFSNKVNGSGIFDIYKPIPGTIEAVHYNTGGEGTGYHDITSGNSGGKYIRNDDVDIADCTDGGHAVTDIEAGEWYAYNANIRNARPHNAGIRYASAAEASIKIHIDGEELDTVTLPSTGGQWRTFTVKDLNLLSGYHTLKVECTSGRLSLYKMQFELANNSFGVKEDLFDSTFTGWYYTDGAWQIDAGEAVINGYGKRTMGNAGWTDYTAQVDVTYINSLNGGLLLRARNLSLGSNGTSAEAGTDFVQGYFITLSPNSVVLGKQNYSWTQLATAPGTYVTGRKYNLKATIAGDNIRIFVDGVQVIDYTDPDPFICGRAGLRTHNAHVRFDNFIVYDSNSTHINATSQAGNDVEIHPVPVSRQLSVSNISQFSSLSVIKADGQPVYSTKLNGKHSLTINVSEYTNGVYLLKLTGSTTGAVVVKKFVKNL